MDFVCGLQKAIDYIEKNITEQGIYIRHLLRR